ncbi:MAG: carbohydrate kinase [Synechococcales cyanobacterium K44_A2020_017]|nr:carbohydrate kinase [Synechococcales cyanobacterium K32_A2020_035]MBF2093479.1 carbohydrate kinase [Synechococcales cyanobacterium K44_A2020_017]
MTEPLVLCLGEVLFDRIADQPGLAVDEVVSWTPYPGGAPANVACALVKLGTAAGFVGCVGEDEPGQILVELLRTTGVNGVGIQRHGTAPTREVYVVRSLEGDRQFAGFGDRDTTVFADTRLQADLLPGALFDAAEILVLGTLELAYPTTRQAIDRALDFADDRFLKVMIDVNWRPMFWPDPRQAKSLIRQYLERADFLKLSDDEALWLFNTVEPAAIAHLLGHVEGVLVTAGEKGCTYYLGDHEGKLPAFSLDVEDTTGAGDSFLAGFIHQLCQRGMEALKDADQVRQMVTYASAVGALTTLRAGAIAAQPTAAEVAAFLYLQDQS